MTAYLNFEKVSAFFQIDVRVDKLKMLEQYILMVNLMILSKELVDSDLLHSRSIL